MCSRTTPNNPSLEVLNAEIHVFIGCYGDARKFMPEW